VNLKQVQSAIKIDMLLPGKIYSFSSKHKNVAVWFSTEKIHISGNLDNKKWFWKLDVSRLEMVAAWL